MRSMHVKAGLKPQVLRTGALRELKGTNIGLASLAAAATPATSAGRGV